jgi:hypothetical protein
MSDVLDFVPHPLTCGKCGSELTMTGLRCPACGHCEKTISEQLAELRAERDECRRLLREAVKQVESQEVCRWVSKAWYEAAAAAGGGDGSCTG